MPPLRDVGWKNYYYDFARDGGAVGNINLRGPALSNGDVVTDALIHVDTVIGSGGAATVAVTTGQGAGDIQAAAAVTGAPWSTTGPKHGSALTATAAPAKMTARRQPAIVVAAAALNAGRMRVALRVFKAT